MSNDLMRDIGMKKRDVFFQKIGIIGIVFCIMMILGIVWISIVGSYVKAVFTGVHGVGTVEEYMYVSSVGGGHKQEAYGSVRYTDVRGDTWWFRDDEPLSIRGYQLGDRVNVYYRPNQPNAARVSPIEGRVFPVMLLTVLLGVLGAIFGVELKRLRGMIKDKRWSFDVGEWLRSSVVMMVTNSMPVFSVLFFQSDLFSILFLYWLETVMTGFFAVAQMLYRNPLRAIGPGLFFLMHFGFFQFMHLSLLLILYGPHQITRQLFFSLSSLRSAVVGLGFSIGSLFVYQSVEFVKEIRKKDAKAAFDNDKVLFHPYGRMIFLHLTLIFGSFLVSYFHQPVFGLICLIVLKIMVELVLSFKRSLN